MGSDIRKIGPKKQNPSSHPFTEFQGVFSKYFNSLKHVPFVSSFKIYIWFLFSSVLWGKYVKYGQ